MLSHLPSSPEASWSPLLGVLVLFFTDSRSLTSVVPPDPALAFHFAYLLHGRQPSSHGQYMVASFRLLVK